MPSSVKVRTSWIAALGRNLFKLYARILAIAAMPAVLAGLFSPSTGKDYGLGTIGKCRLVARMIRNHRKILSASHYLEHVAMATAILRIPSSVHGCLVECGCYKGGSTANLSLIAALCNRRLAVFDSFQGLPAPSKDDREHRLISRREIHTYATGAWRGTLDEVTNNLKTYGRLDAVELHEGYFQDTLPGFQERCVFLFLDVDLVNSLETCLRYLWPLLQNGCPLFSHEAGHHEIASFFFDKEWWRRSFGCEPPGLVGAGNGLGLLLKPDGFGSDIGFTIKAPSAQSFVVKAQEGLE